jgi:hypothetical protein
MMIQTVFYIFAIMLLACSTFSEEKTRLHSTSIYKKEKLPVYIPFSFKIDPMKRLLLVNFEKDPDSLYIGLEPQYFNDPINGKGLLVIAWRRDMKIDVYHEASLSPDPSKFDIAGNGLGEMHEVDFKRKIFEIQENGVRADIIFSDKMDRPVEIFIAEAHPKKRKPFGLLAPMGEAATHPSAMPLILLHDFYFVRRRHTDYHVNINGKAHKLDKLPIPMDGTWMLFARYSPDPFIVTFNPTYTGKLEPTKVSDDRLIWQRNGDAMELKQARAIGDKHQIELTFSPAFPQFNLLKEGTDIRGKFEIKSSERTGRITGTYQVTCSHDGVQIELRPEGGWHPKTDKLSLKFLYSVAKTFKNWPKSYVWSSKLKFKDGAWEMDSSWKRI